MDWLHVRRGDAPLIVTFPHSGTDLTSRHTDAFLSPWLARRDADWWIDRLYAFAHGLGATTIRTDISRSVIDVNRDPSGASLYPGQATTGLCPLTSFDGEPLYRGDGPDAAEIAERRATWFDPYHAAVAAEIARLRARQDNIVLYDAHSIRSHIPRLFDGRLPQFSIGTNDGASCDRTLAREVQSICAASGHDHVLNGRFKGGWTTRHYGRPETGVHAIQMELAMRGYIPEPATPAPGTWPPPFSLSVAAPMIVILDEILRACISYVHLDKGSS
ncbi:N-formylglutamate deformylase [Sphingomonas sp. 2R-10]|uniref:N-formylglutamate deformylase n=1 Tax=Sphingomonas sp. 2R-10 TaxID=3045148 RepID=UPI000F7B9FC0|nr:N-formylglutamate deformylase [Sphingomonas sp. 2R-10]MDJ0278059.1 N-formylglutamate deformylase [Sphingomonas sp. 2R-10]